jgi:putative PIN family toxin of toxin-antitoxin system
MIRVVLDTNIIVSALLQPLGPPARVFRLALAGSLQLCISAEVYAEYEEVIRRPRLKREESVIAGTLCAIRTEAVWTKVAETVRACSDPDDNAFFECALGAAAHYVVTGNLRHFPSTYRGICIVTPRQFLEVLAQQE